MNIYTFPVTCDVCGGEGVGTLRMSAASWLRDSTIVHTDPRVCRDYLELERKRVEQERRELLRRMQPIPLLDIKAEHKKLDDLGVTIERLRSSLT